MKAAIRAINALERRIVSAEDDADAMLWDQARQVVKQLENGVSQRQLAAQWINARTGEPYSQAHVSYVAQVHRDKSTYQPRPRFRDAYNTIANARPPKAPEEPIPFHWMNAADTLHRLCARESAQWPDGARSLLPQLLREVADRFERDTDVSRGPRTESAGANSNSRIDCHDSTAA